MVGTRNAVGGEQVTICRVAPTTQSDLRGVYLAHPVRESKVSGGVGAETLTLPAFTRKEAKNERHITRGRRYKVGKH